MRSIRSIRSGSAIGSVGLFLGVHACLYPPYVFRDSGRSVLILFKQTTSLNTSEERCWLSVS